MRESIAAARRRQRIMVVSALVVGALVAPLAHWGYATGGPARLLGLLPLVLLLGAAVRLFRARPGRGRLRVDVREHAFYVPPRAGVGFAPLLVGFATYQAVDTALRTSLPALVALFGTVAVGFAAICWRRAPGVEVTPEGITHRHLEREIFVPWAALDPAGRVGSPRGTGIISLPVNRPELLRVRGWGRNREAVAVTELDVAPTELAAVLRHYTTRPTERAAIGTDEEYARLRQLLDEAA
ncbi:hypothetical protein K7640_07090 [Micromonospora sp. PLK6-60]|uniref:hypothetical protein n=1 Tax=Micromonospora sp. PLK6-60 TaxID=2873383 RepID=UPI001CA61911|nr:hypothetical protein [Micromonospora sp. PLK6-60]MBY8871609.1 hypothetical protein [Micromonospora sp. PLK6-60]